MGRTVWRGTEFRLGGGGSGGFRPLTAADGKRRTGGRRTAVGAGRRAAPRPIARPPGRAVTWGDTRVLARAGFRSGFRSAIRAAVRASRADRRARRGRCATAGEQREGASTAHRFAAGTGPGRLRRRAQGRVVGRDTARLRARVAAEPRDPSATPPGRPGPAAVGTARLPTARLRGRVGRTPLRDPDRRRPGGTRAAGLGTGRDRGRGGTRAVARHPADRHASRARRTLPRPTTGGGTAVRPGVPVRRGTGAGPRGVRRGRTALRSRTRTGRAGRGVPPPRGLPPPADDGPPPDGPPGRGPRRPPRPAPHPGPRTRRGTGPRGPGGPPGDLAGRGFEDGDGDGGGLAFGVGVNGRTGIGIGIGCGCVRRRRRRLRPAARRVGVHPY